MAGNGGYREGSGRKPLIQNKLTRDLKQEGLDKYPNFNPIVALLDFFYETEDPKLKLDCCEKQIPVHKVLKRLRNDVNASSTFNVGLV